MWKPPADKVVTDTGWRPPADSVTTDSQQSEQPQSDSASNLWGSSPELQAALESNHPIWNSLQVPSQMAKRGLSTLAGYIPEPEGSGNIPLDLAKATPHIAANTLAKVAPGFVDRTAMLTAGASKLLQAAKPIGSVVGQGIAGELESATNANPGSLARAWNDPTLIFGAGKKAAGPMYEAGKAELAQGANIFKDMYKPDQIIQTAQDYLAKGGKLEPAEALIYRKALDVVGRSRNVVKDSLVGMRNVADEAAKASENISAGDAAYQRGLDSESLRRLIPQNKYGGSSAFKMMLMRTLGPSWAGLLSPAVHGLVATAGGVAAKVATNPGASVTLQNLIQQYLMKRNQQKEQ